MRRIISLLPLALILNAGCLGHHEETIVNGPDGTTVRTKTDNSGNVTMKGTGPKGVQTTYSSANGNVSATTTDAKGNTSTVVAANQLDLTQLGVSIYPGSSPKAGTIVRADTSGSSSVAVTLETNAKSAAVIKFYKAQVKAKSVMTTPTGGMISGKLATGETVAIVITKEDNGSSVRITTVKKK